MGTPAPVAASITATDSSLANLEVARRKAYPAETGPPGVVAFLTASTAGWAPGPGWSFWTTDMSPAAAPRSAVGRRGEHLVSVQQFQYYWGACYRIARGEVAA